MMRTGQSRRKQDETAQDEKGQRQTEQNRKNKNTAPVSTSHKTSSALLHRETCRSCCFPSVVVDVVVTVSFLQGMFRRKRQLERRGPTHLSPSNVPGAVSVKGFPNTLIQVNHSR